jgi:hypothetical protein
MFFLDTCTGIQAHNNPRIDNEHSSENLFEWRTYVPVRKCMPFYPPVPLISIISHKIVQQCVRNVQAI